MFNRSGFNETTFNRPGIATFVYLSARLEGSATAEAKLTLHMTMKAIMQGESSLTAKVTRNIFFSADMQGQASVGDVRMIRVRSYRASLGGIATLTADLGHFRHDIFEFTGEFKPGDRIVMDSKNLTLTLNGHNALHMMDGDFVGLVLGKNLIMYQDQETGRNIIFRLTYRDKYV